MKTFFILLVVASFAFAQEKENANNTIYAELGGNGGFTSFNYEWENSENFSTRIGIGFAISTSESNSGSHTDFSFLPLAMLNYLIEITGNNYFELGAGAAIALSDFSSINSSSSTFGIIPTFAIGYRYSPKAGGFFFSLAFDLFSDFANFTQPWCGVGIGYKY